jgi:hypothetical protein
MNSLILTLRRNKGKFLVLAVLLTGGLVGVSILTSSQTLTITYASTNPLVKTSVYKLLDANEGDPGQAVDPKNLVKEVTQTSKFKLRKGRYAVVTSGSPDYQTQSSSVILGGTAQSVGVDPTYSTAKLQSQLVKEQATLVQTVTTTVPAFTNKYKITSGKLYQRGDWYGALIVPNLTDDQLSTQYVDNYRLVAHKENGVWKVLTLPPELIISSLKYPNIPHDILVDVNKLTL